MFQFQLKAIKEKPPPSLPPPPFPPSFSPHDSLFTLLVVIWPYEINRPSSLLLRPHGGEGAEERGVRQHALPVPQLLGSSAFSLSLFLKNLFIFQLGKA